jgi:hypothetical protein
MAGLKRSFSDCPYHCSNGKLLDSKLHKLYLCPYCEGQRKKLVRGKRTLDVKSVDERSGRGVMVAKTFSQILKGHGDGSTIIPYKFIWDDVIPEYEKEYITPDSLQHLEEKLMEVYDHIVMGRIPEKSYIFGLGYAGVTDLVMYPMLARSYIEGLSICKPLTVFSLRELILRIKEYPEDLFIHEELEVDICFVKFSPTGLSKDIDNAKELMAKRAAKRLPTFFITDANPKELEDLHNRYGRSKLGLATSAYTIYKGSRFDNDKDKGYTKGPIDLSNLTNSRVYEPSNIFDDFYDD